MQITVCGQILSYMLWYPIYGSVYLLVWAVMYQECITRRSIQLWEQHWSTQYLSLTIYGKWKIPTRNKYTKCNDLIHKPAVAFSAQCTLSYLEQSTNNFHTYLGSGKC